MTQNTNHQQVVSLTIRNQITEIARMSLWLTGSLGRCGLSRELQFKFDLCANEAVTNIISYGFPAEGEHQILLHLRVDEDKAVLEIEDDGIAFNPLKVPVHTQPKSLSEAKIGGLGIDLMRHYMDRVDYVRSQNSNKLLMQVDLPEPVV